MKKLIASITLALTVGAAGYLGESKHEIEMRYNQGQNIPASNTMGIVIESQVKLEKTLGAKYALREKMYKNYLANKDRIQYVKYPLRGKTASVIYVDGKAVNMMWIYNQKPTEQEYQKKMDSVDLADWLRHSSNKYRSGELQATRGTTSIILCNLGIYHLLYGNERNLQTLKKK